MIVKEARAWLVCMPFAEDILWGSGRRTGVTRLVVEPDDARRHVRAGARRSACSTRSRPCWKRRAAARTRTNRRPGRTLAPPCARRRLLPPQARRGDGDLRRRDGDVGCARQGCGQPLHALWGGVPRSRRDGAYLFVKDPEAMQRTLGAFLDRGFRTFKVKIGVDEASDSSIVARHARAIGDLPAARRRQRRLDARHRAAAAGEARGLRPRLYRAAA